MILAVPAATPVTIQVFRSSISAKSTESSSLSQATSFLLPVTSTSKTIVSPSLTVSAPLTIISGSSTQPTTSRQKIANNKRYAFLTITLSPHDFITRI
ncbi:MAG: hypothetical protein GX204_05205 [Acholeplasmataceae bacterium]|nr:hypothetical protein [Acholeplasmataceae bacterium]